MSTRACHLPFQAAVSGVLRAALSFRMRYSISKLTHPGRMALDQQR
jgi:hypothetical protein